MKKKHHKAEEIIAKLREIEKTQAGGKTIEEACKELGIADQTITGGGSRTGRCRWTS